MSAPGSPLLRFLADEASALLTGARPRRVAVIVVGFDESDAASLHETAEFVADLAYGLGGTMPTWLVFDQQTGDSRTGGTWAPSRLRRRAALRALRAHYAPSEVEGHHAPDWAGEPAIVVCKHVDRLEHRLIEAEDREQALRRAGEEALEGWVPEAVFDLDSGRMVELHIATPVVTPAEDQGLTVNPLERS